MTALAALLFDLDGTLVDTEELHRRAFNEAFRSLSLDWDWTPPLYAELLKVSGGAERIAAYIDRLRHPAAEKVRLRRLVPLVHAEKTRVYREFLADTAGLRPGIARLCEEALAEGLRIGVASSSASPGASALIARIFGPDSRSAVSAVAYADQVARRKPAPDLYELLLATLRAPAAQCVAFEDSANGLAAAKAAGLYTVATPTRWTAAQDFSRADLVLATVGEPGRPLERRDAARIGGAPWLGLAQLRSLRARPSLRMLGA